MPQDRRKHVCRVRTTLIYVVSALQTFVSDHWSLVVVPTPRSQPDPERTKNWERRRRAVGARIREVRLATGLSQESLALESGVSRDQLIQMEHGRRGLLVERLYDLADVLGVPVSDLLADDRDR